jgi:hypothetical protein
VGVTGTAWVIKLCVPSRVAKDFPRNEPKVLIVEQNV